MREEGEILIGRWDCSSCGARGVRGDEYRCGSCGAGRPEDVKFYLTDDAEVVKDQAGLKAANAGADWKCEFCDQWVSATEARCPSCAGGEVSGSERQQTGETSGPRRLGARYTEQRSVDPRPQRQDDQPPHQHAVNAAVGVDSRRSLLSCVALLGVTALLMLFTYGVWWLVHPRVVPAVVIGHSWSRVQHVEELRTFDEEGWDRPSGAFDVSESRRVHHHDRVLDHYETRYRNVTRRVADGTERVRVGTKTVNLGNGRFRREPRYETRTKWRTITERESYQEPIYRREPVYRTYYTYRVERWVAGDDRKEGDQGIEPRWPPTTVRDSRQRMASRDESYTLHLREAADSDPRSWEHETDEATWRSFQDNTRVLVTLGFGGIQKVEPMTPEATR